MRFDFVLVVPRACAQLSRRAPDHTWILFTALLYSFTQSLPSISAKNKRRDESFGHREGIISPQDV
jgi:hypothetical protein